MLKVKDLLETLDTDTYQFDFQNGNEDYLFTLDKDNPEPSTYYKNCYVLLIEPWIDDTLLITITR